MKVTVCHEEIYFHQSSKVEEKIDQLEIIEPNFNQESAQLRRQFFMKLELSKEIKTKNNHNLHPNTKIFIDNFGRKKLIAHFH